MALFWLVNKVKGKTIVFIQEAGSSLSARFLASMAGFEGEFVEMHELDQKTAKRVAKKDVGRVLSAEEAQRVLEKL